MTLLVGAMPGAGAGADAADCAAAGDALNVGLGDGEGGDAVGGDAMLLLPKVAPATGSRAGLLPVTVVLALDRGPTAVAHQPGLEAHLCGLWWQQQQETVMVVLMGWFVQGLGWECWV